MALIVNADDFGLSKNVNSAIVRSFEEKLIDRTTLMVNMPYAQDAMELARASGFSDKVGLHLNLTSGRPLTEGLAKDRIMCGDDGAFTADFARDMKLRFHLPSDTAKRTEEEIRAQLDRYADLGGTLWHVDSHHHVHTDPSIWKILKKVFKDYPVTSVRLSRNMYRGGNCLMRIYKKMLNASIRRYCKGHPAYFGSAYDLAGYFPDPHKASSESDIEVMVHPVFDDNGELCDIYEEKRYKLTELH